MSPTAMAGNADAADAIRQTEASFQSFALLSGNPPSANASNPISMLRPKVSQHIPVRYQSRQPVSAHGAAQGASQLKLLREVPPRSSSRTIDTGSGPRTD